MTENFEAIQEENEQELSGEAAAEEPEETASAGEAEEEFSEETEDTEGEAEADGDEASYDADEAEDESEQPGEDAKQNGADSKAAKAAKAYGFFKKDKKDGQIADLQDRVKRQMAEFENFRKRSEKEKSQMYDMGARSMLEKILPVVDNFERGLDGLPEGEEDPFADGMKMVYKQLMTALTDAGVKEIEAIGKEFDPEIHNAVMHIDDDQYGENEIVEVLQKGYTYHDGVVRHSMVKVAN
ncbi:MAG: nucleotide exchange factor GrpE [Lachnospiraceae bacterium]|nr:nucleotide exchange factor GrpE [Lachnospiraceae bacterium]